MHILELVFYTGILWADTQQFCGSKHCVTTQRTSEDLG